MVNTNLEISINTLRDYTIEMIEKCEKVLELSISSMINQDLEGSQKVLKDDYEIDQFREEIRDKSIELLALKQPMAKDLRYVYSLAMISKELERIGDYAVNIAKETLKIGNEPHIKELVDIPKMYKQCEEMLSGVKYALKNEDAELAREIAEKDNTIDDLYKKVRIDCLEIMNENPKTINQGVQLLFVARHLERVGDHITNICEKVIYIADGKMVEIG